MEADHKPTEFLWFRPPYRFVEPGCGETAPRPSRMDPPRGELLVWRASSPLSGWAFETARARQPGVPLVVILPPADALRDPRELLRIIELCRPHSVLPHHPQPNPLDLQALLRRPPDDLAGDVLDYLVWRGIVLDQDTRHLLRRTMELAGEIRTVSALGRSLYLSRRALGRRFLERGIPVPSHWLHFGRVLRACMNLQNLQSSLFDVASDLGYPDGFALSNQVHRLVGIRPSMAREHLGWEWILETWLRREAAAGGFAAEYATLFRPGEPLTPEPGASHIGGEGPRGARARSRTARKERNTAP